MNARSFWPMVSAGPGAAVRGVDMTAVPCVLEQAMTQDESEQVEELLREWYSWQLGYRPPLGSGRCDATCRDFRISDQWLTSAERAEICDRKAAAERAKVVDVCVDALHWTQRAAIQTSMGNKAVRASVWRHARLSNAALHAAYQRAKSQLLPALQKKGLIKPNIPIKSL